MLQLTLGAPGRAEMFAFVSAFPKSLHCSDEAQQAGTVLSAVLSIYIYIHIYRSSDDWSCRP